MPAHKRSADDMDAAATTTTTDQPHLSSSAATAVASSGDRRRRASPDPRKSDSEGSPASSDGDMKEFVLVKLADIRKEVQCPICLGIIRKTRTVMECLHRFCRECIDKSMRLGNNECPACRTHCASRRSLRDDPNYDTLIAILYPDIDKYEEEELAFHEDEKNRNKQIQASIAQTLRRQNEALGRRRSVRRSQGSCRNSHGQNSYLRGRNRTIRDIGARSDDDVDDANDQDAGKDSSSADERSPDIKQRKRRRWSSNRFSSATSVDGVHDENDEAGQLRDSPSASPVRGGTPEVLVWGRGGTRSHTRYGSLSGSNGKNSRSSRLGKILEHLRNLDDNENELDVHLTILPLDGQSIPTLEHSYLCCRPSLSMRLLCQFISLQIHVQPEDLEILMKTTKDEETNETGQSAAHSSEDGGEHSKCDANLEENKMQVLNGDDTLSRLLASAASSRGDLVLVYRSKLPT